MILCLLFYILIKLSTKASLSWRPFHVNTYKSSTFVSCQWPDLHDLDNHDGVITHTHLEPDILECEVKWALRSITTNKASGGDGIPVELFQILKDDAVKVLHSICQQIWKTQQDWKRSVFIPIPKKAMPKNAQTSTQVHSSHVACRHIACRCHHGASSCVSASLLLLLCGPRSPWTRTHPRPLWVTSS